MKSICLLTDEDLHVSCISLWRKGVTNQKAVKIIAYKNGDGYRNGKLIVAGTFPMVSGYHLNVSRILRGNDNGDSSDKKKAAGLSDKYPRPVLPI